MHSIDLQCRSVLGASAVDQRTRLNKQRVICAWKRFRNGCSRIAPSSIMMRSKTAAWLQNNTADIHASRTIQDIVKQE